MNLKFYHDAPMKYNKKDKEYYSPSFNYQVWKRYLENFDGLDVHTRSIEINQSDLRKELNLAGGPNINIEPIQSYQNIKSLTHLLKIIKEISNTVNDNYFFVLRLPSVIGFLTGLILIIKRKKFLVETVGCSKESFYFKGGLIPKLISYPSYIIQKFVTRKASVATYITSDFLQKRYPTDGLEFSTVSNVHFNFDKESQKNIEKKLEKYSKKNVSDSYKIGLIGSLDVNYKGHDQALKALNILRLKGYDIELYFVGPGNFSNWSPLIKKLKLREQVHYLGVMPAGEIINEWLSKMDFYIQPSLTEGHGRALVEAVYNGCIAFGSNVGGIPDSLNKEYTFTRGDHEELASLIEKSILENKYGLNNIIVNFNNIKKYSTSVIEKKRNDALKTYKKIVEEEI